MVRPCHRLDSEINVLGVENKFNKRNVAYKMNESLGRHFYICFNYYSFNNLIIYQVIRYVEKHS